jgi:hypothetical protein
MSIGFHDFCPTDLFALNNVDGATVDYAIKAAIFVALASK